MAAHFRKFWRSEDLQKQKFFPQYRSSSLSTEILSAVQKFFPQCKILHAVQKFFPQYTIRSSSASVSQATPQNS